MIRVWLSAPLPAEELYRRKSRKKHNRGCSLISHCDLRPVLGACRNGTLLPGQVDDTKDATTKCLMSYEWAITGIWGRAFPLHHLPGKCL